MTKAERSGAELLADGLAALGTRQVAHIPGEGILEIVDALARRQQDITLATFRHEGGMAYAAQAIGHVSGAPGVCLAARAPGALNTCLALHTADTDAAPLVMIVGQAARGLSQRDPLGGDDLAAVFAPLVKWVGTLDAAARIPEMLARAWQVALSGRCGPVVLIAPEDVLRERAAVDDPAPPRVPAPAPAPHDMAEFARVLGRARRPLLWIGGTGWTGEACQQLTALARRSGMPVVTSYRRGDLFDNADPHYAGELGIGADAALARRVQAADLIVALNVRLGELNTMMPGTFEGFSLLDVPRPRQTLVHVHSSPRELNRVYQAELAIPATPETFLAAWAALGEMSAFIDDDWRTGARAEREAFVQGGHCDGPLDLRAVFAALRAALPDDALIAMGAGGYALWAQRYCPPRRPGTWLGPKSGAMGYGLPAAIGAALACPGRRTVALAGDGCFLMHGEELATAVLYGLPVLTLVVNNGGYGAIRLAQQRHFGQAVGTALSNPGFADYARAFGAHGERVTHTAEFAPALARCLAASGPTLIELVVPEHIIKP